MDAVSGLAISLLELRHDEHYLDLCCAPGTKLTLARLIQMSQIDNSMSVGSATGIDISEARLANARALVKKYKLNRTRLFCIDGSQPLSAPPHYVDLAKSRERPVIYEKVLLLVTISLH